MDFKVDTIIGVESRGFVFGSYSKRFRSFCNGKKTRKLTKDPKEFKLEYGKQNYTYKRYPLKAK